VGEHLARSEPALERLHDVDLGIGEQRMQILGAALGVAGDVVVAIVDARPSLTRSPRPPLTPVESTACRTARGDLIVPSGSRFMNVFLHPRATTTSPIVSAVITASADHRRYVEVAQDPACSR
jgi:hypothetical protein